MLELLSVYPALIVLDDVDSLDDDGDDAYEFFYANVPEHTPSKVLFTSRVTERAFGHIQTRVAGLKGGEVREFILSRCRMFGLDQTRFSESIIKEMANVTEGSPLYLEDLLRLSSILSPIHKAIAEWRERGGDSAREYALKRELDTLGARARSVLIAASLGRGAPAFQEIAAVTGFRQEDIVVAVGELQKLYLMPYPTMIEGDERFEINTNTKLLVRRIYEKTDEFRRLERAFEACRGNYPATARGARTPYVRQATLFVRSDEHERAAAILQDALKHMREDPGLIAFLDWVYRSWKPTPRATDAREMFERAYQLRWNDTEMYTHWFEMEEGEGEFTRATEVAERAYQRCRVPYFLYYAGKAQNKLARELERSLNADKATKHFERAQELFERALLELGPSHGRLPPVLRALVLNANALNDATKVRRFLEEWRRVAPDDVQLAVVQSRVEWKYAPRATLVTKRSSPT